MLTVTLIRHGQSVSNTAKRFGSQSDVPLSPLGQLQAQLAGETLAHSGVTRIVSSDLSRAADTARAVALSVGLSVETYPALRERNVGVLTGLTFEEAMSRYPQDYGDLMSGDPYRKIGGGESFHEMMLRVDALMANLLQDTRGHLVLVSHMAVLQHLLRRACGVQEANLRNAVSFSIANAALHRLRFDRVTARWHILALNDTAHLRNLQDAV